MRWSPSNSRIILSALALLLLLGVAQTKPAFDFYSVAKTAVPNTQRDCRETMTLADLNADGLTDCIGTEGYYSNNSLFVFINDGNGEYDLTGTYSPGDVISDVATGMFNEDPFADMAVLMNDRVRIYLGDGTGKYPNESVTLVSINELNTIEAADINGDNIIDLAGMGGRGTRVMLGNGDGTFGPVIRSLSLFVSVNDTKISDLDGDGIPDMAACFWENNTSIHWFKGVGDGTFVTPETPVPMIGAALEIIAEDLDGNGTPDLAGVANGQVVILANQGNGTFVTSATLVSSQLTGLCALDVENDLQSEIIVTAGNANCWVVRKNNDGVWNFAERLPFGNAFIGTGRHNDDDYADIYSMGTETGCVITVGQNLGHSPWIGSNAVNSSIYDTTFEAKYADLNRDGILDVIRPEYFQNRIATLLGNGDGSFVPHIALSFGRTLSVEVADMDRNGWPDIIGNSIGSGTGVIGIFHADGTGGFLSPVLINSGTAARSPIPGDFNNDGIPDIACLINGSSVLRVFLANAAGGFASPVDFATASLPRNCAAGDIDNNGTADIIVSSGNAVAVHFNDGTGIFTRRDFPSSSGGEYVQLLDYDRDGFLDIFCSNQRKSILRNNRLGGFYETYGFAGSIQGRDAAGDLNEDGRPDFLLNSASNRIASAMSTGSKYQLFDHGIHRAHNLYPLADLDRDSHLDASVPANRPEGFSLSVYPSNMGTRSTRFREPQRADLSGTTVELISIGDADHDGRADVVSLLEEGSIVIWEKGQQELQSQHVINVAPGSRNLASGDFNNDGWTDLVCTNGNNIQQYFGGESDFSAQPPITLPTLVKQLVPADINRDAKLDFVCSLANQTLVYLQNNGSGSFTLEQTLTRSEEAGFLATEDFNRDGFPDIVATSGSSGNAGLYTGNGKTFSAAGTFNMGAGLLFIGTADFNRDAITDLVSLDGDTLYVRLGLLEGGFSTTITSSMDSTSPLTFADFNRDGHIDLVATPRSSPQPVSFRIYHGDGSGHFSQYTNHGTSSGYAPVAAELSDDDRLDVVIASTSPSTMDLYQGGGGNYGLHGSPTGTAAVPSGTMDAVLSATLYNRHAPGEASITLRQVGLRVIHADGRPATSVDANNVIDEIRVYRDNDNGLFEPETDTCVSTCTDLAFYPEGITSAILRSRREDEVLPGRKAGYFIALKSTDNAFEFQDSHMSLTLLGDLHEYTEAVEARTRAALVPEWTTNTMTSTLSLPVQMSGFSVE